MRLGLHFVKGLKEASAQRVVEPSPMHRLMVSRTLLDAEA